MNESVPNSIGEQISAHAAVSVGAYEEYLFAVHCLDYPQDYAAVERSAAEFAEDPDMPVTDISTMTSKDAEEFIRQRLVFTFKQALRETDMPKSYDQALAQKKVEVLKTYLVELVEVLAIRNVEKTEWWQSDPGVRQIVNPFRDDGFLEALWKYEDKRTHRQLGSYALDRLAPGYLSTSTHE